MVPELPVQTDVPADKLRTRLNLCVPELSSSLSSLIRSTQNVQARSYMCALLQCKPEDLQSTLQTKLNDVLNAELAAKEAESKSRRQKGRQARQKARSTNSLIVEDERPEEDEWYAPEDEEATWCEADADAEPQNTANGRSKGAGVHSASFGELYDSAELGRRVRGAGSLLYPSYMEPGAREEVRDEVIWGDGNLYSALYMEPRAREGFVEEGAGSLQRASCIEPSAGERFCGDGIWGSVGLNYSRSCGSLADEDETQRHHQYGVENKSLDGQYKYLDQKQYGSARIRVQNSGFLDGQPTNRAKGTRVTKSSLQMHNRHHSDIDTFHETEPNVQPRGLQTRSTPAYSSRQVFGADEKLDLGDDCADWDNNKRQRKQCASVRANNHFDPENAAEVPRLQDGFVRTAKKSATPQPIKPLRVEILGASDNSDWLF